MQPFISFNRAVAWQTTMIICTVRIQLSSVWLTYNYPYPAAKSEVYDHPNQPTINTIHHCTSSHTAQSNPPVHLNATLPATPCIATQRAHSHTTNEQFVVLWFRAVKFFCALLHYSATEQHKNERCRLLSVYQLQMFILMGQGHRLTLIGNDPHWST